MVTAFEFATAGRIVFGDAKVRELGAAAKAFGSRALVVCGRSTDRAQDVLRTLANAGIEARTFSIPGEPETSVVKNGAATARDARSDFVVAIGGGSAIDGAKAIAALSTNPRDLFDYLEVIGKAMPLDRPPLPVIAIPTTAGTGAEVTRNAVITSREHSVKASLRHAALLPRLAIVDPELTHGLTPALTASTGMDALTQLIEPFVSHRANPMTDSFCRHAIPLAARALPQAFDNGGDASARRCMALASVFGGLALANAGLGAVHGFAAAIGGMFSAPHGAVCASLLPATMKMNIDVAQAIGSAETMTRYGEAARLLTEASTARPDDGVRFVSDLCRTLHILRLRDFSIALADLPSVAEKAAQSSSMKANPVPLSREQLLEILSEAW